MKNNIVTPKKHLGQHFLTDNNIAQKIAHSLNDLELDIVIEIGGGTGILSAFLFNNWKKKLIVMDIDTESISYLKTHFIEYESSIIFQDFLTADLSTYLNSANNAIIGNFPYNISSQIIFKILENKGLISEFSGMFQKEVAERIVSKPGSKIYGILSVVTQLYYDVTYLFTVPPHVFNPPPKIQSGVIKATRKKDLILDVSEKLLLDIIKTSFGQRRKTLRNSLSKFKLDESQEFSKLRPEQLSVQNFISLAKHIESTR